MVRRRTVEDAVKRSRGGRLQAIREQTFTSAHRKVSQGELGRRIGRSGAQISKYEMGTDLLDAEKAFVCAQALGCRFLDIFEPGRFELAETPQPFAHAEAPLQIVTDLCGVAQRQLSDGRLTILRDVLLELLAAEETARFVAPE